MTDTTTPSKGSILIVDDTPANLHFLAQLLTEHDYQARAVPNGLRALSSIRNTPPDLILLDIMMPEMDGYEVCQTIKDDPQTQHIPIIFISALDEAFDKVKAFASGGVDYVTKPFQAEEVLARIETHLMIQRLQQELQLKNQALEEANVGLEQKVTARTAELAEANDQLNAEIEQRISHQQEKDRLFELAQQQSEQLRSMTNWLIEKQQTQREGLSTGLDQEIQQKIKLARTHLKSLQLSISADGDRQNIVSLTDTLHLLAEMETYVQQVTTDLGQLDTVDQDANRELLLQLSSRERQVLQMVVEGKTNAEIADLLTITLNTVHTYLKRIRTKLDIHDIPGLVKFAQDNGLIE